MSEELKCKVYDKNTLDDLKYVVVCSLYNDKLLLSRHKQRDTWETQGGHIEDAIRFIRNTNIFYAIYEQLQI